MTWNAVLLLNRRLNSVFIIGPLRFRKDYAGLYPETFYVSQRKFNGEEKFLEGYEEWKGSHNATGGLELHQSHKEKCQI